MSAIRFALPSGALGTTVHDLKAQTYPDGMPLVTERLTPSRILARPRTLDDLMTALWWVEALQLRGKPTPHLILPCLPGARQDRLNPTGDALFTLWSAAREINSRDFPKVTVLDPHSDVAPALIQNIEIIDAATIINDLVPVGRYDAVVSPDGGAEKRAWKVAQMIGVPLLHGWKRRDVTTGKLVGFGLESPPQPYRINEERPPHVLVVDDICDAGGTFLGLGEILKARGYTADLWVTHGYFSSVTNFKALRALYHRLICTDSVRDPEPGEDIEVIPVCDTLLRRGYL